MKFFLVAILSFWLWGAGNLVDKVLFVVDGRPYLLSDYVAYLSMKNSKKTDLLPRSVAPLDDFINLVVLSSEAENRGYSVTERDLDNDIKTLAMQFGKSEDEFFAFVKATLGISRNKFRELRRMYILSSYLVNPVLKSVEVTPAEIESYYRQHRDSFLTRSVGVWLISTSRNDVKEGKYSRNKIIHLFGREATTSIIVKKGDFREDIEKKLFNAERGELIGPMGSGDKFIYLYVVESVKYAPLPLEAVKDKIISILKEQKKEEALKEFVDKVMKNHFVEKCFGVENGEVDYNQRGSCGNR